MSTPPWIASGRAAHPWLGLSDAELLAASTAGPEIAERFAADAVLAAALAAQDPKALSHFEDTYLSQVPSYLARRRLSEASLDEIKQRVRERLFVGPSPKIKEYAGRGPLGAWLRVLVMRVAANWAREQKPHDELSDAVEAGAMASPELQVLRARTNQAFASTLHRAFLELSAEERAIFRLQFGHGLSLDAIAKILGVHRATAARRIKAAREALKERMIMRLAETLGASPPEVARAIREWQSKLELSLSALFQATGADGPSE